MENYAISVILQRARESLHYSRNDVCRLCQEQFSEKTLYRVELGITKASNDTIEKLSSLYKRPFGKLHTTIDMNRYSMLRIYGEIIDSVFCMNLTEAEYKLNLFEKYVEKSAEGADVIELLKLIIRHYKIQDYTNEGRNIISDTEELLHMSFHPKADISIYPLTDMELNVCFIYIDALKKDGQYEAAIELINKLLKNINQKYHNESIFCDYYGLLNAELATIYKKTERHEEAMEIVRQAIQEIVRMGDLTNVYQLLYIFVQAAEEREYFHSGNIKRECVESLKKMYSICLACNMQHRAMNIKKRLANEYGVSNELLQ